MTTTTTINTIFHLTRICTSYFFDSLTMVFDLWLILFPSFQLLSINQNQFAQPFFFFFFFFFLTRFDFSCLFVFTDHVPIAYPLFGLSPIVWVGTVWSELEPFYNTRISSSCNLQGWLKSDWTAVVNKADGTKSGFQKVTRHNMYFMKITKI